jgi:hypothetical protein
MRRPPNRAGLADHSFGAAAISQLGFRFSEAQCWFAVSIRVRAVIADIVFRAMARNAGPVAMIAGGCFRV